MQEVGAIAPIVASEKTEPSPLRDSVLAGLANYIDAGSIVAGSAALALWAELYRMTPTTIGLIGAFSANAISAGVGALIGGVLCDRFGRKRIYQYDMLFYAFGMAWLTFAAAPWMIVLGFVLVGLAVGADIPASWSLIAEIAPKRERARYSGIAQILWYLGPVVVLTLGLILAPLGLLGIRLVFGHLLVLALVLTLLRSRMRESRYWEEARAAEDHAEKADWRQLLQPKYLKSILFLIGMYGFWNLWAGTNGFFFPYILRTVGGQSQEASVALQALTFGLGIVSIWFVFMKLSDRVNQRALFLVSALMQVGGMALLAVLPLTGPVAVVHIVIMATAMGFGAQSFFQLWSAELFPTLLRSTAQGVTFAVVRIGLGVFSFFVPLLTATGFHTLAWILVGFLLVSAIIGWLGAPRNEGKSLEEIEAERA
ncbi:MFS transporter [Novosphingobium sp. JCM 18896]|uniref:MFS transporter n=1 Tax=Novosphingobium sp. JCM 18896 TaxID=2989731 RepID=UPI00222370A0|nr:MFS transporter [Novosphingobium sp. JCM 18896]